MWYSYFLLFSKSALFFLSLTRINHFRSYFIAVYENTIETGDGKEGCVLKYLCEYAYWCLVASDFRRCSSFGIRLADWLQLSIHVWVETNVRTRRWGSLFYWFSIIFAVKVL